MLTDALLFGAIILLGLKYGLRTRLRELGRVFDGLVNVLLGVIVLAYGIHFVWFLLTRGG
jgi:hypothetical protein